MKKLLLCFTIIMFITSVSFSSCAKKEKQEAEEKGAVETLTEQAAKEATEAISKPLEKAQEAKEKQEEKVTETEKTLKE